MNKKISFPIAVIIIIVCAVSVAGLVFWQYLEMPKGEVQTTEKIMQKDETADWKTYKNEKYGFEVEYPTGWKIEEFGWSAQLYPDPEIIPENIKIKNFPAVTINFDNPIKNLNLRGAFNEYIFPKLLRDEDPQVQEVKIGDINALTFIDFISRVRTHIFYNPDKNNIIAISFNNEESDLAGITSTKILNQILFTFKFIEPTWKIYWNDEFGFEMRHPKDWYFKEEEDVSGAIKLWVNFENYPSSGSHPADWQAIFLTVQKYSINDWLNFERQQGAKIEDFYIGPEKGYKSIVQITPDITTIRAAVAKGDYLYVFNGDNCDEKKFNEIVSTFNFLQ